MNRHAAISRRVSGLPLVASSIKNRSICGLTNCRPILPNSRTATMTNRSFWFAT